MVDKDDEPLQTISELVQDRLLTPPVPFPKLTWARRQSRLGYFYWERQDAIRISEHIRWMDIEDQGDQSITESELKNFASSVTNSKLPSGHSAGWEILVGRHPIKPSSDLLDAMENGGWATKSCAGVRYPVLFRIHHSIGDGLALVNLLLNSLSDPSTRCSTPVLQRASPSFNMNFVRPKTPDIPEEPEEMKTNSWEESDLARCMRSRSCDQMFSPDDGGCSDCEVLKRRNTVDVTRRFECPLLESRVKVACRKVYSYFTEANKAEFRKAMNQHQSVIYDVHERRNRKLIDLLQGSTDGMEGQTSNGYIVYGKYAIKYLKIVKDLLYQLAYCVTGSIESLVRQFSVFTFAPALIINQALTQSADNNVLHGPRLSGHKVVAWHFEQLLMSMIKRIRSKTGARFSDVLLTAISASLELFYSRCDEVPRHITVVIPARLGICPGPSNRGEKVHGASPTARDGADYQLENKFSVAMLILPIATEGSEDEKLFGKLKMVRAQCDLLRGSPDYLVNYWLLRVFGTLLPCAALRPLLRSTHSTLVLSNLPGPTRLAKLAGHTLHDLVFWVPNRTTTGVGLTALSYAGRLQLGLMADRALVPCQQDAQLILDGVAAAVQRMDAALTQC